MIANYKCFISFIATISLSLTSFSQNQSLKVENQTQQHLPRQLASYDKEGSYVQVLNADQTTVSAGDKITINQYLSGYGNVDTSTFKIFFSASADIFDKNSTVSHGYGVKIVGEEKTKHLGWKGKTDTLENSSGFLILSGFLEATLEKNSKPKTFTMFDDSPREGRAIIMTERDLGKDIDDVNPPLLWELNLKEDIRPGDYYINFILTYFNGEKWQNDQVQLPIRVMPWYEKWDCFLQTLALLVAILTLGSLGKEIVSIFSRRSNSILSTSVDGIKTDVARIEQKLDNLVKKIERDSSIKERKILSIKKTIKRVAKGKKS